MSVTRGIEIALVAITGIISVYALLIYFRSRLQNAAERRAIERADREERTRQQAAAARQSRTDPALWTTMAPGWPAAKAGQDNKTADTQ